MLHLICLCETITHASYEPIWQLWVAMCSPSMPPSYFFPDYSPTSEREKSYCTREVHSCLSCTSSESHSGLAKNKSYWLTPWLANLSTTLLEECLMCLKVMLWEVLSHSSICSSLLSSLQLEGIFSTEVPDWILMVSTIKIWESPSTSRGKEFSFSTMQMTFHKPSISALLLVSLEIDPWYMCNAEPTSFLKTPP